MPAPGDLIGHYVIERPLGRGGEASAFQARDAESGRRVVVKVLEPSRVGEVAAFERFRREVAIGRLVEHPGIPQIVEAREDGRPPYIVLEYMEGQSLRGIIDQGRQLPLERALEIATSLAEVLAYCHAHHIYHRDLKPENILVDAKGGVKIIDFGIALLEGAPRVTWRGFSGLVGTPEYMAPEQIRGERGGPQTDVYALGLILYEMLAGRPPFHSPNPLATMYQHLNMSVEPLHHLRPAVPASVAAIVARAMRRRKEERFADAGELHEVLRHAESVNTSILDRPDPPMGTPPRDNLPRRSLIMLGVVALATAALVVLTEVLLRH
jgi:eukaryotic-like serine/threonine-protein kinase